MSLIQEAELVKVSDSELIKMYVRIAERLHQLKEDERDDEKLQALKKAYNDYKNEVYKAEVDELKKQAFFVRRQLQVRKVDLSLKELK